MNLLVSADKRTKLFRHSSRTRTGTQPLAQVMQTLVAKDRILTDETAHLILRRPYLVSPKERAAIQNQVKEMLVGGSIEASKSPWPSSIGVVANKDGSLRFFVHFSKLNTTKKDVYPLSHNRDTWVGFAMQNGSRQWAYRATTARPKSIDRRRPSSCPIAYTSSKEGPRTVHATCN